MASLAQLLHCQKSPYNREIVSNPLPACKIRTTASNWYSPQRKPYNLIPAVSKKNTITGPPSLMQMCSNCATNYIVQEQEMLVIFLVSISTIYHKA